MYLVGLLFTGSTHHLPIELSALTSVCVKWLTKYLIILILSVLFREPSLDVSYCCQCTPKFSD